MDLKLKKIVILHASAGHGHQKAAEAIQQALMEANPNLSISVFDALDYFPPFIKKVYVDFYVWMMKHAGWLWGFFFKFSNNSILRPMNAFNRRLFNGVCGKKLERMIASTRPDLVISTHFMPPEIIAAMKQHAILETKVLTVVTDMLVHRFWIAASTDMYTACARETQDHLVRLGVSSDKIRITGIPIHSKFATSRPSAEVRQELGLQRDKFTILFTSGGVGATAIDKMIRSLLEIREDIQIISVCGNNKGLKLKMDTLAAKHSNLLSLAFVSNMDELMDAADVLVGKAGGLTTSESLAKGKPIFIIDPVPGQETANARILSDAGASFWVHKQSDLNGLLERYISDPALRKSVSVAIAKYAHPESARRVADVAMEMLRHD